MDTSGVRTEPYAGKATLLESYPLARYEAMRAGEIDLDEFIEDFLQHERRSLRQDDVLKYLRES